MTYLSDIKRIARLIPALVGLSLLLSACDLAEADFLEEQFRTTGKGVLVLCEGNFNSGNASLSYYDAETKKVENGIFRRANDRKLGDTGQSITIQNGMAYIAVENSGIIWKMNTSNFRVEGQLTAGDTDHMINPRYVHFVSADKAYATDLYSPYITVFNPQTMQYTKSIATGQPMQNGYSSTEEMVQVGNEVFTNCWSYSHNILIIDTQKDCVTDSIVLPSWQPKSMAVDANKKLWVVTDGGYDTGSESFGEGVPHLYRIDPKTRQIELDLSLNSNESLAQITLSPDKATLYILNNDVYRMDVTATSLPTEPFLLAPRDDKGLRHKLYGINTNPANGEIYLADAVDYRQAGVAYRYSSSGTLLDQFRVGILPNHFAFTDATSDIPEDKEDEEDDLQQLALVDTIFEYMPAPGHQVNGYTIVGDFIHDGATMQEACAEALRHFRNQWMVSLGGQGGYLVAGFREPVDNTNGDYELAIKGNPYSYQSEPGIIWVSMDENGDGEPNDPWYELAGSEYGTENETLDYAITYYKPNSPESDIRWTDNQGGEGIIPYMKEWNTHPSYWQDWVPTERNDKGEEYHTYYGSRLRDTHTYDNGYTFEPPFAWGYADNDGSDYFRNQTVNTSGMLGYFKLSNAVKADGTPANLPCIHFVKVQTGQTGWSPNLGEISTEVYGIWKIER